MQAATAGREGDFGALLRRLGERAWRDPMAEDARAALAGLPALLEEELGVAVPAAAMVEAHETARLLGGTRYRAFSPSDTCPDNNLVTSHGVRFVDFEWGCFRDVVLDAAYFRVPFPACETSFALPDGMAEAMLAAWRDEIAAVWPDLDESDRLERRLTEAQLLWAWLCTWWMFPRIRERDMPIGPDSTRSPRISTALTHYWRQLEIVATAAELPATADTRRRRVRSAGPAVPGRPAAAADLPGLPVGPDEHLSGAQPPGNSGSRASISGSPFRVHSGQIQDTDPSGPSSLLQDSTRASAADGVRAHCGHSISMPPGCGPCLAGV